MRSFMLSTNDNPYSPYTQYEEWYALDVALGHNTCSLLARSVADSDELSETDSDLAYEQGVASIIANDLTDTFVIVYE